jgi:hypothetical protein
MQHTIRQQYDKMNQSNFKSSLRSNFEEGISPQRNSLTDCQRILQDVASAFEVRQLSTSEATNRRLGVRTLENGYN